MFTIAVLFIVLVATAVGGTLAQWKDKFHPLNDGDGWAVERIVFLALRVVFVLMFVRSEYAYDPVGSRWFATIASTIFFAYNAFFLFSNRKRIG